MVFVVNRITKLIFIHLVYFNNPVYMNLEQLCDGNNKNKIISYVLQILNVYELKPEQLRKLIFKSCVYKR